MMKTSKTNAEWCNTTLPVKEYIMLIDNPYTAGEIICADRKRDLYLVRTDNDVVFESWASSTKHPDFIYHFNEWNNKSAYIDKDYQIYQWLLFIASDVLFPFHAKQIAQFANEVYRIFNE